MPEAKVPETKVPEAEAVQQKNQKPGKNRKKREGCGRKRMSEGVAFISEKLAAQCSPVIKGIKPSNLLMLRDYGAGEGWWLVRRALWGTSLEAKCLYGTSQTSMWLVYRKDLLGDQLDGREQKQFLEAYGYQTGSLPILLGRLSERLGSYKRGEQEFPHELGVFLGYPMEDVRGFISHKGKDSICTGYWKVYGNAVQARRLFALYDDAREDVSRRMKQGLGLKQIAV